MSEVAVLGDGGYPVERAAQWIRKARAAGYSPRVVEDCGKQLLDVDVDKMGSVPPPDLVGVIIQVLNEEMAKA